MRNEWHGPKYLGLRRTSLPSPILNFFGLGLLPRQLWLPDHRNFLNNYDRLPWHIIVLLYSIISSAAAKWKALVGQWVYFFSYFFEAISGTRHHHRRVLHVRFPVFRWTWPDWWAHLRYVLSLHLVPISCKNVIKFNIPHFFKMHISNRIDRFCIINSF